MFARFPQFVENDLIAEWLDTIFDVIPGFPCKHRKNKSTSHVNYDTLSHSHLQRRLEHVAVKISPSETAFFLPMGLKNDLIFFLTLTVRYSPAATFISHI